LYVDIVKISSWECLGSGAILEKEWPVALKVDQVLPAQLAREDTVIEGLDIVD
jgi:hypothetical protein